MLSVLEAEQRILNCVIPLDSQQDREWVSLFEAQGRILADGVTSSLDFPHWDNSAMDGYAVRFADVQNAGAESPVVLDLIEEIPAGCTPQRMIQPGQAARILTGSMMPTGADTIVIQEHTQRQGDRVSVLSAPEFQEFVRHRADFYRAGDLLLPAGIELTAPEIAVLAAAQCISVPVYRRLNVAILSTGNELVSPEQSLQPGQIVDSNQYALAALIAATGATPMGLGIVPDAPDALKRAIAQALSTADVILSSGGVSVGDYDYVDTILEELGADIHVRSVAVKPGKPLTVATFRPDSAYPHKHPILYVGLPGNPVSALVSFWRFVEPALRKQSGLSGNWSPVFVTGRSPHNLKAGGTRETYLWGQLHLINGQYEFRLSGGSHSSGNLINLSQTNALAIIPVGQRLISAGESIQIMQVNRPILS